MSAEIHRYYRLSGAGHLAYAEWFEATNDEDAISQVEAKYPRQRSEVWLGTRLVARLSPKHFAENGNDLQDRVGNRLSAPVQKMPKGEMPSP